MKKYARFAIVWLLLIGFFNVLSFVTPEIIEGSKYVQEVVVVVGPNGEPVNVVKEHFSTGFWVGYIFANISLVLSLVAGLLAFRSSDARKQFYGLPIITATMGSLTVLFLIALFTVILPVVPVWINIILMLALSIFAILAGVGAEMVGDVVGKQDREIAQKTMVVKSLISQVEGLENSIAPEQRDIWQKVYEALRYADPMSAPELAQIESQISDKTAAFVVAVTGGNVEEAKVVGQQLMGLISQRNMQCKLYK